MTTAEQRVTTSNPPATEAIDTLSRRVALETLRQRRRQVLRSVLMIVAISVLMVLVVLWNRDEAVVRSCAARMAALRDEFQRRHDQGLLPPPVLPVPSEGADVAAHRRLVLELQHHVYYEALFSRSGSARREVGVCCCHVPHDRLIGPTGRHVLVFDTQTGRYTVEWVRESDFPRRAAELGLRVPGER